MSGHVSPPSSVSFLTLLLAPRAMTYLLEIKKDYALPLLEVLQQQQAIELHETLTAPETGKAERKIDFSLLQLDTRGFKFNREEANER